MKHLENDPRRRFLDLLSEQAVSNGVIGIAYCASVLRPPFGLTVAANYWLFWAMSALFLAATCVLFLWTKPTFEKRIVFGLLPVEVHLFFSLLDTARRQTAILVLYISAAAVVIEMILKLVRRHRRGEAALFKDGKAFASRLSGLLLTFSLGLSILMLPLYQVHNGIDAICLRDDESGAQTIESNMLTLYRIHEFDKMTEAERKDIYSCIAEIETSYLGLKHPLRLCYDLQTSALGSYCVSDECVHLSDALLEAESAELPIEIICEQAFYAYAHELVVASHALDSSYKTLLFFYDIEQWEIDFDRCINGTEDALISSSLRRAAQDYAKEAVDEYIEAVEHEWAMYS